MTEAVFVPGKRKYVFCSDQEGMKLLFNVIEQVKEEGRPYEIFKIEENQDCLELGELLKKQKMGTHLYVALPYAGLEKVRKTAEEIGFTEEETQYIGYGKKVKRIFCCRCHGMNETADVQADILCSQCGLELSISDHYSVFHNAFLGYVSKL
ncbi:dimethylamine monooxygenase subunit DmmA family protein [Fictibacillus halophilus]|uniref:dimethylamine monooxygenase subunit DmmA family protein n=1 Tax=Fictibacillus halophilus TaxID=1610490 RepID=UPI0036320E0D